MPDKANFTRAEASVQLALVKKKGDYIACVADGFFSLWTGSLFGEKNSEEREGKRGGGGAFPFPYPARPKACSRANGFALQARKTNQLGRLVISQRTFQPGKHYGFIGVVFVCGSFKKRYGSFRVDVSLTTWTTTGTPPPPKKKKKKQLRRSAAKQPVSVQKCNHRSQG